VTDVEGAGRDKKSLHGFTGRRAAARIDRNRAQLVVVDAAEVGGIDQRRPGGLSLVTKPSSMVCGRWMFAVWSNAPAVVGKLADWVLPT
jgi:hypothetical protein